MRQSASPKIQNSPLRWNVDRGHLEEANDSRIGDHKILVGDFASGTWRCTRDRTWWCFGALWTGSDGNWKSPRRKLELRNNWSCTNEVHDGRRCSIHHRLWSDVAHSQRGCNVFHDEGRCCALSGAGLWPIWTRRWHSRCRTSSSPVNTNSTRLMAMDLRQSVRQWNIESVREMRFIASRISFTTSAEARRLRASSASWNAHFGKSLVASRISFTTKERLVDCV